MAACDVVLVCASDLGGSSVHVFAKGVLVRPKAPPSECLKCVLCHSGGRISPHPQVPGSGYQGVAVRCAAPAHAGYSSPILGHGFRMGSVLQSVPAGAPRRRHSRRCAAVFRDSLFTPGPASALPVPAPWLWVMRVCTTVSAGLPPLW